MPGVGTSTRGPKAASSPPSWCTFQSPLSTATANVKLVLQRIRSSTVAGRSPQVWALIQSVPTAEMKNHDKNNVWALKASAFSKTCKPNTKRSKGDLALVLSRQCCDGVRVPTPSSRC